MEQTRADAHCQNGKGVLGQMNDCTTSEDDIKTLKRRGQVETSVDSNSNNNQASAILNSGRAMCQVKAGRYKEQLDKPNKMGETGKELSLDDTSSSEEESESTSSINSSDVISNPELQNTVLVSPPSLTGYC